MKTLIGLLVLWGLIFWSSGCCKDHDHPQDDCMEEALILGADARECVCCGGWFIEIGQDTLRGYLPAEFVETFNLNDLPLPVVLEWERSESPCLGDEIEIYCISLY